jgi:hypothetical protein
MRHATADAAAPAQDQRRVRTVADAMTQAHGEIRTRAEISRAREAAPTARQVEAYDAEISTLSGYLAVVEAVVYPVARRRVPGGHALVAAQLRAARRIERQMRLVQGRLYGDQASVALPVEDLQRDLTRLVSAYLDTEMTLAERLDTALPPEHRERLATAATTSLTHAPTRPHPYTPHFRGAAKLMLGVCSVWDRAFDVMDNRIVPALRPPRRLRPLNSWDRYLLGRPDFDEAPRASGPTETASTERAATAAPTTTSRT